MNAAERRGLWVEAWHALGIGHADDALLDALLACYGEPHRAYHTLQHLDECLAALVRERREAERAAEVALALWFHDAIYDVHRHDNEERSAAWARKALIDAKVEMQAADRVHALVMATRHDVQPKGVDAQLLIDIDLSILGAPVERFAEYERQIRIEYAHIAPDVFEPRRRAILQSFLMREPLYLTPAMRERYEASARTNLANAVA